ncbi:MAG: hypothetical protein ACPGXY_00710 [Alphaproteobacteria bacterium]
MIKIKTTYLYFAATILSATSSISSESDDPFGYFTCNRMLFEEFFEYPAKTAKLILSSKQAKSMKEEDLECCRELIRSYESQLETLETEEAGTKALFKKEDRHYFAPVSFGHMFIKFLWDTWCSVTTTSRMLFDQYLLPVLKNKVNFIGYGTVRTASGAAPRNGNNINPEVITDGIRKRHTFRVLRVDDDDDEVDEVDALGENIRQLFNTGSLTLDIERI